MVVKNPSKASRRKAIMRASNTLRNYIVTADSGVSRGMYSHKDFSKTYKMIEDLKNPKKEEEEEMQEAEELKAELSKPASKPLKHNPEANKTVKKQKFAKQQGGTMSRVLNRISNK